MTRYEETTVTRKIVESGITVEAIVEAAFEDYADNDVPRDDPEVSEISDVVIDDLDQFIAWLHTKIDLNEYIMEEYRGQ